VKKSSITFISLIFTFYLFLTCGGSGPTKSDIDVAIQNHYQGKNPALKKDVADGLGLGKGNGCEALPKNVVWYQWAGYYYGPGERVDEYRTNHWDTEILEKWSKGNFAEVKVMYRIMGWVISTTRQVFARTTNGCKPETKTAVIKFVKEEGRWKVNDFNDSF
jgi:hypothetical protein